MRERGRSEEWEIGEIAPGSIPVSSKSGSDGVRIAHDATIRSQSTNDHASSGRAGQNNPHRGGEIRSENRFASKHVLAALKSRTTAEARIWVREIIVVVLSFNFFELHPGDRVSLLLHLSSAKIELAQQMSQWLISATSRRGRLQRLLNVHH